MHVEWISPPELGLGLGRRSGARNGNSAANDGDRGAVALAATLQQPLLILPLISRRQSLSHVVNNVGGVVRHIDRGKRLHFHEQQPQGGLLELAFLSCS